MGVGGSSPHILQLSTTPAIVLLRNQITYGEGVKEGGVGARERGEERQEGLRGLWEEVAAGGRGAQRKTAGGGRGRRTVSGRALLSETWRGGSFPGAGLTSPPKANCLKAPLALVGRSLILFRSASAGTATFPGITQCALAASGLRSSGLRRPLGFVADAPGFFAARVWERSTDWIAIEKEQFEARETQWKV